MTSFKIQRRLDYDEGVYECCPGIIMAFEGDSEEEVVYSCGNIRIESLNPFQESKGREG